MVLKGMSGKIKSTVRLIFFLSIGLALIVWSVRDLSASDREHIQAALKQARYWLAIPGFLILIFSHYARALRWKLLIEPMGYKPTTANVFFAVMTGYLANQAVPRLGEVVRCTVLTRYEHIPFDKLFGTVILERIFDTLCLLIIFLVTLAIQPDLYARIMSTFFPESAKSGTMIPNLLILGAIGVGVILIAVLIWMVIKKKKVSDVIELIKKIAIRVWEGLTTIRHLKKRGSFIFLTFVIWFLYALSVYVAFIALSETQHLGVDAVLTVLCAGSVGMISTPGGIGAYPFLLQKTLLLYSINSGTALALGWFLWLIQIMVVLVAGLFSLVAFPIYNRRRKPQVP
jgi:uncharacterized protein (TIRG00374 family)